MSQSRIKYESLGPGLLEVNFKRTPDQAGRFDLELVFEEHSGVRGDLVTFEALGVEDLILLQKSLNNWFAGRKPDSAADCPGFEPCSNNTTICRVCGSHVGNHPHSADGAYT